MEIPTETEIRDFVGPNAEYYLEHWHFDVSGSGRPGVARGFNWHAFFFGGIWLAYRKMYAAALILLGLLAVAVWYEASRVLGPVLGLLAGSACGTLGNGWYLRRAERCIAKTRSELLSEHAYPEELAKRGGGSVVAALAFLVIGIAGISVVWVLASVT